MEKRLDWLSGLQRPRRAFSPGLLGLRYVLCLVALVVSDSLVSYAGRHVHTLEYRTLVYLWRSDRSLGWVAVAGRMVGSFSLVMF